MDPFVIDMLWWLTKLLIILNILAVPAGLVVGFIGCLITGEGSKKKDEEKSLSSQYTEEEILAAIERYTDPHAKPIQEKPAIDADTIFLAYVICDLLL